MSYPATSFAHDNEQETSDDMSQILTFTLNHEEYGVDILQVNTIREWTPITTLPDLPDYVRGVLNLRGNIVPIIDLRARFSLPLVKHSATTVVILLNVEYLEKELVIGIVVDSVSDTYTINGQDIKERPQIGEHMQTSYLSGLVDINDTLILLLDISKLLSEQDMAQVSDAH